MRRLDPQYQMIVSLHAGKQVIASSDVMILTVCDTYPGALTNGANMVYICVDFAQRVAEGVETVRSLSRAWLCGWRRP
jgi:hypothetical protein